MEDSKHFQQTHIAEESFGRSGQNGDDVQFNIIALYTADAAFVRQGATR
jgi:hypothetical protein